MKILRIVAVGHETGGIENHVQLMRPILEARGHDVRVFASNARPDLPHFSDYTYKKTGGVWKLVYSFNPFSYLALRKVLREFKPDVVHVHTLENASYSVLTALSRVPTVFTIHGPELFVSKLLGWCLPAASFADDSHELSQLTFLGTLRYIYHQYMEWPLRTLALANVNRFVTLSRYMQRVVRESGIENTYIQNGTTLLPYIPLTTETFSHTLLYVGRVDKVKGITYLLDALPEVLEKFPDTTLTIAGDGPIRGALEASVRQRGLEHAVTFVGHVNREALAHLYRETAITVMPSVWPEAFGKVGIEAMSVGRPVIATNVGGVTDWLHDGENGYLVPPGDAHALALRVLELLRTPERACAMGVAGRVYSERFTLDAHTDKMLALYEELVSDSETKG